VAVRREQFELGHGLDQPTVRTCEDCGYSSTDRRHFRRTEEGYTCHTGHYKDAEGKLKRQRNPYARGPT
jgi:hypothetical protein